MPGTEDNWLAKMWYGDSMLVWLFIPLSWIYRAVTAVRAALYRKNIFKSYAVAAPVIVIGNITVGGTGKTPLTIWLAQALEARGYKPGIVSRGYRGSVGAVPVQATADSDPEQVGDEAILLASESRCPVVVHPERVAAAKKAIEIGADVILADDGLQHYRLQRDYEIAVVDGHRGFGNGRLLPAGPLRENSSRLDSVDKVVIQRRPQGASHVLRRKTDRSPVYFSLVSIRIQTLDGSEIADLADFAAQKVHAVAGIGNPGRFFALLESYGMIVIRHPLPDHASLTPGQIRFDDDLPVIMTSKDAVKCRFPEAGKCWVVEVDVKFEEDDGELLLDQVVAKIVAAGANA